MPSPARDDVCFFIRHAHPPVQPDRPAHEWPLSDEGRAGADRLAHAVLDPQTNFVA